MINQKYNYTPCDRTTIAGSRHYCLPDGSKVPSVTTILDRTKPQEKIDALNNWKKRMGEARAKQITTEAANRGTRMHTFLEHYVKHDDMKTLPENPFAHDSWFMAAEVILQGLSNMDEYWGVEVPVYYSGLYAGTTDCVGVWKGRPAIVDFKQSNSVKKEEYIDDYKLQLCAYAQAHNHTHDTDIKTGVIMMSVKPVSDLEKPRYQEFVITDAEFAHWSAEWNRRIEQFYLNS